MVVEQRESTLLSNLNSTLSFLICQRGIVISTLHYYWEDSVGNVGRPEGFLPRLHYLHRETVSGKKEMSFVYSWNGSS